MALSRVACEYTCDETMVAWQEAIAQAGVAYRPGLATRGRRGGCAANATSPFSGCERLRKGGTKTKS